MNEIANDCSQTKNSNCQVNCKLNGTMLCTSKSIGDPWSNTQIFLTLNITYSFKLSVKVNKVAKL